MSRRRQILAGLGLAAILAGGALSFGPPRVTLVNTALRIDYPWPRGVSALVAAGAAALVGAVLARRGPRIACGALSALILGLALDLFAFRLEAGETALTRRDLLGAAALPWADVTRVESGPDVVVVWGRGEDQIRIGTSQFEAGQRAALDRTLARRVREARPAVPLAEG